MGFHRSVNFSPEIAFLETGNRFGNTHRIAQAYLWNF
jgi:hypothetical protein